MTSKKARFIYPRIAARTGGPLLRYLLGRPVYSLHIPLTPVLYVYSLTTKTLRYILQSMKAFVFSDHRKHWLTNNYGETWIPFETPVELAWVANPLSFHADVKKTGYILFQGRKCEPLGWTVRCYDEVSLN
jgi:hypothetical protein